MAEQSSRTVEERFVWEEGDATLPSGWKMRCSSSFSFSSHSFYHLNSFRVSDGEAEMQWFLSPEGLSYRSRYTAVQDMIKKNFEADEVEHMKELMVMHEGWQRSSLLPDNWLFKVKCEGFTKEKKWYSSIHYFTEEGETIESMKNVLTKLKETNATSETIENCNQFMMEQKPADVKYDWSDGDKTVPKGWKLRISESESEWQWMLSPDGAQFRSRYTAVQHMVKKKYKRKEIEEMKELMILHEGWQRSSLLPKNWLFKIKSEGFTKDKKWYSSIHYFTEEGETIESFKNVLTKLKETNASSKTIENCNQFIMEQKPADVKYDWNDGDNTVPKGWKLRISDGECKKVFCQFYCWFIFFLLFVVCS